MTKGFRDLLHLGNIIDLLMNVSTSLYYVSSLQNNILSNTGSIFPIANIDIIAFIN